MKETDINSIDLNLRYYFAIDYDTTPCKGCDDYCRCGQIINATIKTSNIELDKLVDLIRITLNSMTTHKKPKIRAGVTYTPTKIEKYCIERLFSIYKLYDTNNYDIKTVSGYYGEEIGAVTPKDFDNITNDIKHILCFDNEIDKIKFILNKEYGHLLDIIDASTQVVIKHVCASELYKNDNYFSRIKKSDCNYKLNNNLPIGVVYENNNSYRLIDGYHRTILACGGNYPYIVIS